MSQQCNYTFVNGQRCKLRTNNRNGFCHMHQPTTPVIKTKGYGTAPKHRRNPSSTRTRNSLPWLIPLLVFAAFMVLMISWIIWTALTGCPRCSVATTTSGSPTEQHPSVQPPAPANTPTATSIPTPATAAYPLAGQWYYSNRNQNGYDPYAAVWELSGWLHQPYLPPEGHRTSFDIAITIEEGRYTFSGTSCDFWLDENRTGKGAVGNPTLGRGNNIPFTVDTADGGQAWGIVVCRDDYLGGTNDVVGFSIKLLGPLP